MTVFFMPFCRNASDLARRGLLALVAMLLLGLCIADGTAWAGSIEPAWGKLSSDEDAYALSAEFNIDLGSHIEETVARGVPLYFVLELEITRNRWFWPGEHIAGRSINYRLAYIPLTRQYRLSSGGALHQNFATLSEALHVLGRVAALPIADKKSKRKYCAGNLWPPRRRWRRPASAKRNEDLCNHRRAGGYRGRRHSAVAADIGKRQYGALRPQLPIADGTQCRCRDCAAIAGHRAVTGLAP